MSAYLLKLDGKNAYRIMRRDARNCPSPNSGYTMATTAGALNIQLIKKETYILGDDNKDITADDISKAVKLSKLTIILFTLTIILLLTLLYVIL
jgi:adenosylcobinamide-phosphate synthase